MITINLTKTEQSVLVDMLERLSDHMANAGCNDYDLPADEASKLFLIEAYRHNFDPDQNTPDDDWMPSLRVYKGRYGCHDGILLGYLKSKIEAAK